MIPPAADVTESVSSLGGFREDAFENLYKLESSSFWFRSRNQLILWALRRYFPSMLSFLEIGCGTGYVLGAVGAAFPEARLSGSDLFENALTFAAQRTPQATFSACDARHMPFKQCFDVVGMFDVLEHIPEDESVLAQIHGALKPGGGLILTVPQHPTLWTAADDYARHVRRYTRSELCSKLTGNGFVVQYCTSFVTLLLPVMMLFRALQSASRRQYVPTDEMETASHLNVVLESVMTAERFMIERGVDFRVGGSLIAVCTAK